MRTMLHDEVPLVLSADDAREGVTGHGVRYVLAFSMAAIVVVFAILLAVGA